MRNITFYLILFLLSACTAKQDKVKTLANRDKAESTYQKSDTITPKKEETKPMILETVNGKMSFNDMKQKSSSFIRYSRNQYFARKGYVFNDENLQLFFEHQDWYNKANSNNILLDEEQTKNVEFLKYMEDNYGTVEYSTIIHKFKFENYPLFYIGWDPQTINNEPDEFFDGGFALMDTSMLWTLDCSSIPPEYLIKNSLKFIELMDDQSYIRNEQIEFTNIDSSCFGGEHEEIIIHLEGPSDDYNDIILGFDENSDFNILFDQFVTIDNINKLNDSTLELVTTIRCDFIGTMFCESKYHFNTITKQTTNLPYEYNEVRMRTTNREEVVLYSTSLSAIRETKDSIVTTLKPETRVEIIRYIDESRSYQIKTEEISGWVNQFHLHKFNVSFAD